MATHTQTKPGWRSLLRRLIPKATPYWRERLDDEQEQSEWRDILELIVLLVFQVVVFGVTLSAMAQLALVVFVVPDGLPGVIGRQLAEVCQVTGNCDFGYLLAGYALALGILAAAVILIFTSFSRMTKVNDRDRHKIDMAFLDARFVELREELMAAGILTKPPEEMPEDE